jgi:UDP-2-acetamido-2,6-beta-L-arabino-hexul-4-ose reductase
MDLKKLIKHEDSRGLLVEAMKFPNDGQLYYIICNPEEMRANHYHLKKTEIFVVIYGSAEIAVKDRETGNVMYANVNSSQPIAVTVVPNHTHRIVATKEGAIIIVYSNTLFDKDDPDTYSEEI